MKETQNHWLATIQQARIRLTRVFLISLFILFLFSRHKIPEYGILDLLMESVGLILIFIGVYGRLWCTLFISGYKDSNLITVGPYSVCRNPLYFFSFVAILGIAIQTEMFTVIFLVLSGFAIFYPAVIKNEEKRLREAYGAEYEEYCRRVPRFFPNFKLYNEPEKYVFDTRHYRKAFLDGIWFVFAYPVLEIIEQLHEHGILPVFFRFW